MQIPRRRPFLAFSGLIGPFLLIFAAVLMNACAGDPVGPTTLAPRAPALAAGPAIFSESFEGLMTGSTGSQCVTGNVVYADATISGWTATGFHAAHGVQWQAGNKAVSFYDTNALTLNTAVFANDAGVTYQVDFLGGPSVWNNCAQATALGDGVIIEILRSDNSVLATHTYFPSPWAGSNALSPAGFTYVGDGSGGIRIRLSDNLPYPNDRFGGAIDDIAIREADPTNVNLCKNGGWRTYRFRNQGQCVRYVQTGKDDRLGE